VRRSLTWTVAAAVSMVLLAMLVPMALLLRGYALEDRISRAALEVQATETVVSGDDVGIVSVYLDRINSGDGITTSVVYPDGPVVGPDPTPGEAVRIAQARSRGTARIDDVDGGSVILVPVSLGRGSDSPESTPVVRVLVEAPGLGSTLLRSWLVLLALGLVLLGGALLLADRLGRSFTRPIHRLAGYAAALGERRRPDPVPVEGPVEVRELAATVDLLVERIEVLLTRERASIADLSHRLRTPMTALRLRVDGLPADAGPADRARLAGDLDELQAAVDQVVREARRSEREGLVASADAVAVVRGRIDFWRPLAEDQGRPVDLVVDVAGPVLVRCSEADLAAALDVLLDNAFAHTPDEAAVVVTMTSSPGAGGVGGGVEGGGESAGGGGVRVVVADAGPGLATTDLAGRGVSGAGSSGLGLSIAARTAEESGGSLGLGRSAELGGAEVVLDLGPA